MKTEYFRRRYVIKGPDGSQKYDSINQAKKASRQIQLSSKGLGCGILKVEK